MNKYLILKLCYTKFIQTVPIIVYNGNNKNINLKGKNTKIPVKSYEIESPHKELKFGDTV